MNNNKEQVQSPQTARSGNFQIWALIALIVSIATAAFTFTLAYDAQTGYLIGKAANVILVLIVSAELVASLVLVRSNRIYINDRSINSFSRVLTLILHLAVIFCGVMTVIGSKGMIFSIDASKNVGNANASLLSSDVLMIALLFISATIFLSSPALRKSSGSYRAADQINGYSTIFLCILGIALLYFDMSVEMNNPQKLLLQFSLASICLAELFEMKWKIQGKGERASLSFKLFSIILAPSAAVSTFIALAAKSKPFPASYLYFAITVIAYALFYVVNILFSSKEE